MVGIVIDINKLFFTDTVIEPTTHPSKGLQSGTQLILINSAVESHRRCRNGILYIEKRSTADFNIEKHSFRGAQIKEYIPIIGTDVNSIIVGLDAMRSVRRVRNG